MVEDWERGAEKLISISKVLSGKGGLIGREYLSRLSW